MYNTKSNIGIGHKVIYIQVVYVKSKTVEKEPMSKYVCIYIPIL